MKRIIISAVLMVAFNQANGEETMNQVGRAVLALKKQGFTILTLGVITEEVGENDLQQLIASQTAPPRQMRIFVTQNQLFQDIFKDFTYLVKGKKVDCVLIWPAESFDNSTFIKKITMMSKHSKVPVIALQDGWMGKGALFFLPQDDQALIVDKSIAKYLDFSVNENTEFKIEYLEK